MSAPATNGSPQIHAQRQGVLVHAAKLWPWPFELFDRHVKPHLTPLNGAIAAVIGLVTVGFVVLIALMIMVATNFNLLGAIE